MPDVQSDKSFEDAADNVGYLLMDLTPHRGRISAVIHYFPEAAAAASDELEEEAGNSVLSSL